MNTSEQEFITAALEIFPKLAPAFKEYEGLLHLQMDCFRYQVEQEIIARNRSTVLKAYVLTEKCYRHGSASLKDAVDTCFVEGLLVGHTAESKKWAWAVMPHVLRELHTAFWGKAIT